VISRLKLSLKSSLATLGFYHPALGVKISPEAKATLILKYKTPALATFVETGTRDGWMLDQMKNVFDSVYSIEVDEALYRKALIGFNDQPHIKLFLGDSATVLPSILRELSSPALFWLDAHGEGPITAQNAPVIDELRAILSHPIKKHAILIDDARHFDRTLIREMKRMALVHNYTFDIESGIFRLHGR
jgi:hypothetical protein